MYFYRLRTESSDSGRKASVIRGELRVYLLAMQSLISPGIITAKKNVHVLKIHSQRRFKFMNLKEAVLTAEALL